MIKRVDKNGNVRLITNIRKPRKWRRFEYLLSSGTLWIDTGYKPNGDTRVVMKFLYTSYNSPSALFGARNTTSGSGANNFNLWCMSDLFGAQYNGNDWASNLKSVSLGTSEPFIVDYNKNICTVKGVSATFTKASFTVNYNLLLLALLDSSGVDSRRSAGKLYYCKVYDNDVLIRDFVPAQYNGQYGMWDLVEDKFYPNKGTGIFTVGPEMKNYDEIYEVKKAYSILPSGVELYDYILSSGTLWIDTNYFADLNKDLEITTESLITSTGRRIVLGNYSGNQNFNLEWNTSNLFRTYLGSDVNVTSIGLNTKATAVISWKASSTLLSGNVNGTMFSNVVSSAVKVSTLLFRMFKDTRTTDSLFLQPLRIYKVSIKENGVFVRNWLPCTYLGEPGMWDTVENKFYRNQGTGLFTLGNKITLKEYEYLQSDATAYIDTNVYLSKSIDYSLNVELSEVPVNAGYQGINWLCQLQTLADTSKVIYTYDINNKLNSTGTFIETSTRNGLNFLTAYRNWTSVSSYSGNIYLFNFNYGSNPYLIANRKIYYCKIKLNNQLVRDFIPVSYNGTPGLWDKVEWKFYANAGSGSFTLGPEKNSGIYPIRLKIEYLLGNGTSTYIDSGINPRIKPRVVAYMNIINNGDKDYWGNSAKSGSAYYANFYLAKLMYYRYGTTTSSAVNYTVTLNTWHIWDVSKEVYVDDDLKYTSPNTYTYDSSLSTILIFKAARSSYYSEYQLGWLKIYDGDTLVRDFIPVRIGTTGALYDKIEGKVYFNSGTGNFTLGPDINL